VPKDPVTSGNAEAGVFAYVQPDAARSSPMSGSVDEAWTGSWDIAAGEPGKMARSRNGACRPNPARTIVTPWDTRGSSGAGRHHTVAHGIRLGATPGDGEQRCTPAQPARPSALLRAAPVPPLGVPGTPAQ
jgi:hypothetical protein